MVFTSVLEAARIFGRRIKVGLKGIPKYSGNADSICLQIIRDCYNKEKDYFMTSNGHFCEFYARDFGWCTEALLSLGYRQEVVNTLGYALSVYSKKKKITQSISPQGWAFTFPNKYSPDALAFLIRGLKLANAGELVLKYQDFLNKEIKKYYNIVIDKTSGLVRSDRYFSSIKDHAKRKSSCYDNVMTAVLANDLEGMHLDNPFKKWDYSLKLVDAFWTGEYFLEDMSGSKVVCGDANVIPFWAGVIFDKVMLKRAMNSIRKEGLDRPFPLKYSSKKPKGQKMIWQSAFASSYERDSAWPHIGLMYIKVISQVDKGMAIAYLDQYRQLIENYSNFIEVYSRDGRPYQNLFYHADDSMLWAANYLFLKRKILG